ncbi:hypothetical protein Hypma_008654 [Hypsizygus marmoreus]|uniref:F-box domain-containing protein n=1 Tax=Hypsizygus marmoreus TaxID=39966 RepID=A0A369JPN5_HYPMA|nr:hypothetical protein Hypma_008654 [Hypsizygus marmoreus]
MEALRAQEDGSKPHSPKESMEDQQDASTSAPSRKRRRTNSSYEDDRKRKHVRGRRGALKGLVEMPMDILFEILGHLTSADILRLSWMSKALRGILMNRSSAFIWKTARANVEGLPDCPPFLNEPQYAAFMFDSTCDYCRQARTQTMIWDFTRCCHKCAVDGTKFQRRRDIYWQDMPFEIDDITPSVKVAVGRRTHEKVSITLIDELRQEFENLKSRQQKQWLANKATEADLRKEYFLQCKAWLNEQAAIRLQVLDETRQRRTAAIKQKLTGLGWGEDLEKLNSNRSQEFDNLSTVKIPKDLSDRAWEGMKEDLIQWMEGVKAERLKAEFRAAQNARRAILVEIYASFMASQPLHAILPPVADVAVTEPFRTIVDLPLPPEGPVVTAEHFAAAVETLPDFVKSWWRSADAKLLAVMRACKEINAQDIQESSLNLATTFFDCERSCACREQLSYPHVLVHHCALYPGYNTSHEEFKDLDCQPWNFKGKCFEFSSRWYNAARYTLEACGLDPDTTILEEVQHPTFFIECVGCIDWQTKKAGEGRNLMTWERAVCRLVLFVALVLIAE